MEQYAIKIPKQLQFTDDELYAFCQENRDLRFERNVAGEIIIMLPTGGTTGKRNSKLVYKLNFWNEQHELGIVFDSSTGFILPNGAMRSPDASWVRLERWDALTAAQQEKFPPLCPDFVAELLSPSDNLAQAQQKMTEWMENGCRLGWLLHPTEKLSWVYEAGKPVKKVGGLDQTLSGGRVLPGFEFDLQLIK